MPFARARLIRALGLVMEVASMRWSALLLSLILNLSLVAGWPQAGPDEAHNIVPPAQPVVRWLKAVKAGDQKLLKTVFSETMRKEFDEVGWDKVLKTYQEVFGREIGDYKLEEFAFEYTGGEDEGEVLVVHKGKKFPGLRVIKEQAGWKVNER